MTEKMYLYEIEMNDNHLQALALIPPAEVEERGTLPLVGILGYFPMGAENLGSLNFQVNPMFMDLLHEFVRAEVPENEYYTERAAKIEDGTLHVVDFRTTPGPEGEIVSEDILGTFSVQSGAIDPGSYAPNEDYQLMSDKGLMRLGHALEKRLYDQVLVQANAA